MSNTGKAQVMREWVVSAAESGMRILPFLRSKLGSGISARQIKRAIDTGHCQLNGKIEKFASSSVGAGDRIVFCLTEERRDVPFTSQSPKLDSSARFLYLDDDLAIYDKPSGIASNDETLQAAVRKRLSGAELVHRLDRDTTGALIFAHGAKMREAMMTLFKKRKVRKTYLALVDGIPSSATGVVENYLGKLSEYHGQSIWGVVAKEKGVVARTTWKLEKAGKEASLLTCYPETGRTHQIRVHLSGLGHPILGDFQYGRSFRCAYRPGRVLLHAASIAFEHPLSLAIIEAIAPLPTDFVQAVDTLVRT